MEQGGTEEQARREQGPSVAEGQRRGRLVLEGSSGQELRVRF